MIYPYTDFFITFLTYEKKMQLKIFSSINKCINIKYNNILF